MEFLSMTQTCHVLTNCLTTMYHSAQQKHNFEVHIVILQTFGTAVGSPLPATITTKSSTGKTKVPFLIPTTLKQVFQTFVYALETEINNVDVTIMNSQTVVY